ncbi:MAG TPA: hypothetical protein VL595_08835 [Pseudonocardia sp.]|jgi:hypothetical protein|nr:hypothetical protein [Pseudonocardia sp.]
MARRNSSSITNLLSNIVDDIKDFVDDEVIDRGRDTERDLRKAGRNWTDSDDDAPSNRADINELAKAVEALSAKVDALSKK